MTVEDLVKCTLLKKFYKTVKNYKSILIHFLNRSSNTERLQKTKLRDSSNAVMCVLVHILRACPYSCVNLFPNLHNCSLYLAKVRVFTVCKVAGATKERFSFYLLFPSYPLSFNPLSSLRTFTCPVVS